MDVPERSENKKARNFAGFVDFSGCYLGYHLNSLPITMNYKYFPNSDFSCAPKYAPNFPVLPPLVAKSAPVAAHLKPPRVASRQATTTLTLPVNSPR